MEAQLKGLVADAERLSSTLSQLEAMQKGGNPACTLRSDISGSESSSRCPLCILFLRREIHKIPLFLSSPLLPQVSLSLQ